jgi:hypothetical protein
VEFHLEIKWGWKGVKNGKFETKEFATFAGGNRTDDGEHEKDKRNIMLTA